MTQRSWAAHLRRNRLVPAALWHATRSVSRVSPLTAGHGAALLWGVPWRPPRPTDPRWLLDPGLPHRRDATVTLRVGPTPGLRATIRRIRVALAGQGPSALVVHGWSGVPASFDVLAAALCQAGMRVVAVQLPAHGSGNGLRTDGFQVADALTQVAIRAGAVGLVGHSFGAFGALIAADGQQRQRDIVGGNVRQARPRGGRSTATVGVSPGRWSVERMALIAPCVTIDDALSSFTDKLPLPTAAIDGLRTRIEHAYGPSIWQQLDFVQRPPQHDGDVLVVHDRDDERLPVASAAQLAARWPAARFVETRGLGHHDVLADPQVTGQVVDHLAGAA